jgi:FtsP/CotA-like multicopper oxidase with cupredoxin domain
MRQLSSKGISANPQMSLSAYQVPIAPVRREAIPLTASVIFRAEFDIETLYVWHCHIVEHEGTEMMHSYYVA